MAFLSLEPRADGKMRRILLDANVDLSDLIVLENKRRGLLGGHSWVKARVSSDWVKSQIPRLESSGYEKFIYSESIDLNTAVFSIDDWGIGYWHSSMKDTNKLRYSILYSPANEVLTLISFAH